jgi:hypothetical protein
MPISLKLTALSPATKPCLILQKESSWPQVLHNLNIQACRLDVLRDEFVWLGGGNCDLAIEQEHVLDGWPEMAPGLYKIASVRCATSFGVFQELMNSDAEYGGALFFEIADHPDPSNASLEVRVREHYRQREIALTAPIVTKAALLRRDPIKVTGVVFGVGTAVHQQQDLRGISIIPYGQGMSYEALRTAVNQFLTPRLGWTVNHDQRTAEHYAGQTPTFVIVFHELHAVDQQDAMLHMRNYAININTILGVIRGATPRIFALYVTNGKFCNGGFEYDNYRGNLLAPMTSTEISHYIERLQLRMNNPRTRLLLELCAEAVREPIRDFQYLRLWTLLELMAKDAVKSKKEAIVDHEGKPILDKNGKRIFIEHARSKVYKYLFDLDYGPQKIGDEEVSLWKVLGAAYEVRNSVAHAGTFRPDIRAEPGSSLALASAYYGQTFDCIFDCLNWITWACVMRETNSD